MPEPPEAVIVASFADVMQPGSGGEIFQAGPESDGSRGDRGDGAGGTRQGCFFRAAGAGGRRPTHPLEASRMGSLWPTGLLV